MGELSLFPAVRTAATDALVLADGTSCRHQIKDGTGREAHHVARVLAMSLSGLTSIERSFPQQKRVHARL